MGWGATSQPLVTGDLTHETIPTTRHDDIFLPLNTISIERVSLLRSNRDVVQYHDRGIVHERVNIRRIEPFFEH
jgi:hypothetical protein